MASRPRSAIDLRGSRRLLNLSTSDAASSTPSKLLKRLPIAEPIDFNIRIGEARTVPSVLKKFENPVLALIASLRETKKSPTLAVKLRTPPVPLAISETTVPNAVKTPVRIVLPMSRIAKTPLKVRFRFSVVSSPILKLAVKSRIRFEMSANCLPVIGGKISRKASLIGLKTSIKALNEFLMASMIAVRPPSAFQSPIILLRASADSPMSAPSTLLTSVKSSLASSKSPKTICHV